MFAFNNHNNCFIPASADTSDSKQIAVHQNTGAGDQTRCLWNNENRDRNKTKINKQNEFILRQQMKQ